MSMIRGLTCVGLRWGLHSVLWRKNERLGSIFKVHFMQRRQGRVIIALGPLLVEW